MYKPQRFKRVLKIFKRSGTTASAAFCFSDLIGSAKFYFHNQQSELTNLVPLMSNSVQIKINSNIAYLRTYLYPLQHFKNNHNVQKHFKNDKVTIGINNYTTHKTSLIQASFGYLYPLQHFKNNYNVQKYFKNDKVTIGINNYTTHKHS